MKIEGFKKDLDLKEIKIDRYDNKEKCEDYDLDKPVLEQIENSKENIDKIKLEDIEQSKPPELEDWDLNKPILEQIENFQTDLGENNTDKVEVDEKERRSLTDEEKKELQEKTDLKDSQLDKCEIDEDGTIYLKTDNEHLEGQKHDPSGVEYVRKTIEVNGVKIEVVVPDFDSKIDVQLPEDLLKESNPKQFKECNEQLKDAVDRDSELRSKFTEEQLEDIADRKTPEGYTWHHDAEEGKMQLVETKAHDRTQGGAAHTGGKSIWGGGYN